MTFGIRFIIRKFSSFLNFMALKFLWGRSRNWLASFLTLTAILGVTVSVMAFIVVQSVMGGVNQELRSKILGFSAHVTLTLPPGEKASESLLSQINKIPQLKSYKQFVESEAVLRTEEDETQGIRIRGIDPSHPPQVKDMEFFFEEGEGWESFAGSSVDLPGILVGTELAASLGLVPFLLEKVELLYPFGEVGPTGEVEPSLRSFRVLGVFKSGYYQYDSKYALISLPEASYLFGENLPQRVGLFLNKPEDSLRIKKQWEGNKQFESVKTWQEIHSRLFTVLKLEKMGMYLVLGIMMVLASFNILSLLMMMVFDRRRDIAVLRALGASTREVYKIFERASLWIGLLGGSLGVFLGAQLSYLLPDLFSYFNLRFLSFYYFDTLPVKVDGVVLFLAFALAQFLCFFATLIPMREIKKLSIVEALRYE